MNINKATLYAFAINLYYLSFSGQAIASSQSDILQHYNDSGIDTVSLSLLYPRPSDFLWIEQQQLNVNAYEALEFIADAVNHGLDPNDYHNDLLQQLDPMAGESDARLFDLMLSDGLLKLIRDMSTGRLDPAIVDPQWSIPRATFDATEFLQQALSTGQLKDHLISLIPASAQYQQLQAAAKRYRDYVSRGGWFSIPETSTLHPGDTDQIIPAVRRRLAFENETSGLVKPDQADYYDEKLQRAVQQFQRRHSLTDDAVLGPATINALNVSATERLQQINMNMERLRWLPDNLGKRYIMVNLANYQLNAIEDEKVKLNMRVIVGKTERPTPSFSSTMSRIVFNPLWYIPDKLARMDLLPKQQANPDYFNQANIRVFNKNSGYSAEIDPASIDWHSLSEDHFPYALRQEPGKKNALGRLKFILPNEWSIYLHDTPSKGLFNRTQRNFSSGCIRVEDPLALANFSLTNGSTTESLQTILDSEDVHSVTLEQPISVYAIYATVWLNGDELTFSPDSYDRDKKMAQYL